jgi:YD repeat-containing protein
MASDRSRPSRQVRIFGVTVPWRDISLCRIVGYSKRPSRQVEAKSWRDGPLGVTVAWVNAQGRRTSTVYDAASRAVATVNPLGRRSTTTYDAASEAVAAINPLNQRTVHWPAGQSCATL